MRRLPKLCRESDGRAFVRVNQGGKRRKLYLGQFGSDEAQRAYEAFLVDLTETKDVPVESHRLTVDELCLRFMTHAEQYYVKDGCPTSEVGCLKSALKPLIALFGHTPVIAFGPKRLAQVRKSMVDAGRHRKSVNKNIGRIRTVFKWGVSQEFVPASTLSALQALPPLLSGRTPAVESIPRQPVSVSDLIATLRELSPVLRSMVLVQARTGMRPGEVLSMTWNDIDQTSPVWIYRPASHKTQHHGKRRAVWIGPKAQRQICGQAVESADEPVFQSRRGEAYTIHGYRWGIRRACERAGIELWCPARLRHTGATLIRKKAGLETSRIMLGHSSAVVTEQHYAAVDAEAAMRVAAGM